MKNNEKLQDAIGNIDEDLILEAKNVKKNHNLFRYASIAACLSLAIAAIPIIFLIANREDTRSLPPDTENNQLNHLGNGEESTTNNGTTENQTGSSSSSGENDEYWTDTRLHNSNKYNANSEYGIIWPWHLRTLTEQYRSVTLEGFNDNFICTGKEIGIEQVGEMLTNAIAFGYDNEEQRHELGCEVYSIKGVSRSNIIAVKLDGYDKYYVYKSHKEYDPPATLGELIEEIDLIGNMSISTFCINSDITVKYLNSTAEEQILAMLLECGEAPFGEGYHYGKDERRISFSATSNILGFANKSFTIYEGGFLFTNIDEYAYYFNIGEENAKAIINYALANVSEEYISSSQAVAGTITEIGENYFKINDAVMMNNEKEGIEFTVYTDDIRIMRYFKSDFINVGDLAVVNFDGDILNDGRFVIYTAYSIDECFIVNGDVLIPE